MDVHEAIDKRRAYRSIEHVEIAEALVTELGKAASLAPSCFNNQPWRFVFVYDPEGLERMQAVLSTGNAWANAASMMIAVFCKKDDDCLVKGREYYLFDVGMATGFLMLRATELGLVAHPIAGYDEDRVKEVLGIPEEMTVIALLIVGKRSETISPVLSEKQVEAEKKRPGRLPLEKIVYHHRFQ